jgi:hypothetical protein
MSQMADGPHLIFQPSWWEIELMDGSLIELRADGAKESSGVHSFVILVEGEPHYELEVFRIPKKVVKRLDGVWPNRRLSSSRNSEREL